MICKIRYKQCLPQHGGENLKDTEDRINGAKRKGHEQKLRGSIPSNDHSLSIYQDQADTGRWAAVGYQREHLGSAWKVFCRVTVFRMSN